jgi:hypothetical protein
MLMMLIRRRRIPIDDVAMVTYGMSLLPIEVRSRMYVAETM